MKRRDERFHRARVRGLRALRLRRQRQTLAFFERVYAEVRRRSLNVLLYGTEEPTVEQMTALRRGLFPERDPDEVWQEQLDAFRSELRMRLNYSHARLPWAYITAVTS